MQPQPPPIASYAIPNPISTAKQPGQWEAKGRLNGGTPEGRVAGLREVQDAAGGAEVEERARVGGEVKEDEVEKVLGEGEEVGRRHLTVWRGRLGDVLRSRLHSDLSSIP
jgi:hypothetical protein